MDESYRVKANLMEESLVGENNGWMHYGSFIQV